MVNLIQIEERRLKKILIPQLRKAWRKFRGHVRDIRKKPTPDGVHDLRVSIRRLRALVTVFEELMPDLAVRSFHQQMRRIMKPFGDIRDLHVQFDLLSSSVRRNETFLNPMLKALEGRIKSREAALKDKDRKIPLAASRRVMDKLLTLNAFHVQVKKKARKAADAGIRNPVTRTILQKYLKKCFGLLPLVKNESDQDSYHRLRVAVKKLRYKFEFLYPLLEGDYLEPDAQFFKRIQDALGDVHDRDLAISRVMDWFRNHDPDVLEGQQFNHWMARFARERHERYQTGIELLSSLTEFHFMPSE